MIKIKLCYIISNIDKVVSFEWIGTQLNKNNLHLSFILLNPGTSMLESFLLEKGIPYRRINYHGLNDVPQAFINVLQIFNKTKPNIIHCHLFHATLIGLMAGRIAGIKKRIYTRHHSTYNWQYNKKGVKIDKLINWLATDIVSISKNVSRVLIEKEKVKVSKIHLIHHGFDLLVFSNVENERVEKLNKKYNPHQRNPVIGVIARWIEWKGIQYIIPAFKVLLKEYPNALLILANASGPYRNEIRQLMSELPEASYRVITFENDLFALYQLFDIYLHTPVNSCIEAFGQTYVEALAAGIPSIFTLSGISQEFISESDAKIVPFRDSERILESMFDILNNPELRKKQIQNGRKKVEQFAIEKHISALEQLYSSDN